MPKMGLPLLLDLSASPISLCLALFVWTLSRPSAQNSTDLPPSFAVVDASREQAIGVRGTTTPASISRRQGEGIRPPHDPAQGRAGSTINIPPALKAGWWTRVYIGCTTGKYRYWDIISRYQILLLYWEEACCQTAIYFRGVPYLCKLALRGQSK